MKTLLLMLLIPFGSYASAQIGGQKFFRHEGQTVTLGDSKYEVMARIGPPDGKLQRDRHILERTSRDEGEVVTIREEKWLYNFGPRRFFHVLTFEEQVLTCIEEGDYGYANPDPANCHPVSERIKLGEIMPIILMKCGEASFVDVSYLDDYVRVDRHHRERISVRVEEWTYNFGPGQPLGILRFEDGELVEFVQGPRGF